MIDEVNQPASSRKIGKRTYEEAFPDEVMKTPEKKGAKRRIALSGLSSAEKKLSKLNISKGDVEMNTPSTVITKIEEE